MTLKKIYFAGGLFDHKQLCGNALLAQAIEAASNGRYECVLPQDLELASDRAEEIRNQDLKQVFECDLALFNFDGTELDSGTVVEFIYAKFLDKPSVILRSDFRQAGDQQEGEPWNLMCSFYPRTESVVTHAMADYHQAMAAEQSLEQKLAVYHQQMAEKIVAAFDKVVALPSVITKAGVDPKQIEAWAKAFAGNGYQQLFK